MKKFFCVSGAAVLFWLLGGCSFEKTQQVQSVDTAMGTVVQQSIYTREADSGAARDILELTKSLEQEMLSRRLDSSQVYAVNAGWKAGGNRGVGGIGTDPADLHSHW